MLAKMFMFEWRYFTRQPSFYVSMAIFFFIALTATGFKKFVGNFGGNVFINGPFFIGQVMGMLGLFSMFVVVNFIANTALRDHQSDMAEILYCKPFKSFDYQLGRFLGSFAVVVMVFSAVPLGLLVGSLLPWVANTRLGPVDLSFYLTTFFYLSVPTLLVFCCVFYVIAMRLRTMMSVYLSVIAVFVLYGISNSLFLMPEFKAFASLLDPFGQRTFAEVSRYWTVFDKNNQSLTLTCTLLYNRLFWLAVAALVLVFFGRFSASLTLFKPSTKKSAKKQVQQETGAEFIQNAVHYKGYLNAGWQQFVARTVFEIKQVIFTPAFIVLCSFMFLMMMAVLFQPKGMFGSTNLPYTQIMVQVIKGSMAILSTIIITYYSAEVVWRERISGMGDIIDSTPVSNLSFWLSKLLAVWAVVIALLLVAMGLTIAYQLGNGFNDLDIKQYLVSLFYFYALPWMMTAVVAFLFQVISPNKYVGMVLFVLFIVSGFAMESLGLGHNMFRFSKSPVFIYTDLDGYGFSMLSHSWYMVYWGALSVAFSIVGFGLWQRGPGQSLRLRLKQLPYQIGGKGKVSMALAMVIFVASGSHIFYNTRVLNSYASNQQADESKANYEKRYGQHYADPIPAIIKLNAAVDIYPKQRKITGKADFEVVNRSSKPIKRFLVSTSDKSSGLRVEIAGGRLGVLDGPLNTHWFEFDQPMQPGEKRQGHYQVSRQEQGFVDKNALVKVVENGTFFEQTDLFPFFGYFSFGQLQDIAKREKYGLGAIKRANKLEDTAFHTQNQKGFGAALMDFETTVSTSADQIAIAPGYLIKEWSEGGRRYFHYKMDAPIPMAVAYLSARYQQLTENYKNIDVSVYYHPGHTANIERMQQGLKDAIDYFGDNFGAYPYRQARIIEFPGYRVFAQSFPNTIAFSERIGFITDLRNEDEIDQIYYVTAHEMAHQWWGHMVDPANVQGATMVSETLAQYSALMLFKRKFGDKKLRRILKIELDKYLRGRSGELVEELPLMRVENQQYIHYRKGAVAMMALVDLLGEQRINQALRDFVAKFKFKETPYPTSMDLLAFLGQDANEAELVVINRLFGEINLYDFKVETAKVEALADDRFEVTLNIFARRLMADGQGIETEVDLSQMVDIGVFVTDPDDIATDGAPLYLQKHLITSGKSSIEVIVDKRPEFVGIDPFVKFIDRDVEDNVVKL